MLTDRQLTPAERHLIEAAGTGEIANLGEGGELDDPARAGSWSEERSVRAEVIVELLTGQRTPPSGFLRAVKATPPGSTGSSTCVPSRFRARWCS